MPHHEGQHMTWTARRIARPKVSPVWSRTADGIVARWGSQRPDDFLLSLLFRLRLSERRIRLFVAACHQTPRVSGLLGFRFLVAARALERLADGELTEDEYADRLPSEPPTDDDDDDVAT